MSFSFFRRLDADGNSGIMVLGDVKGDVHLTTGHPPSELSLDFDAPRSSQRKLSWLSWHSAISEFLGRDREMNDLLAWAGQDTARPLARFVTGDGGMGKSRLGAELCRALRAKEQGWAAGFAEFGRHYRTGSAGTLMVIDYPEENRDKVAALLRDLSDPAMPPRLRLLLLSRKGSEVWDEVVAWAGADRMFDARPTALGAIDADAAFAVFNGVGAKAASMADKPWSGADAAEFQTWWGRDALHRRPLFIVAAAVHAAEAGPTLRLGGAEVIQALVDREVKRLNGESRDQHLGDHTLARLHACAALAGGLTDTAVERVASVMKLPEPSGLFDKLVATGRIDGGMVPAPKPDIMAACLVASVLGKAQPSQVPEWIWSSIEDDVPGGLDRVGRLAYDAEVVLGLGRGGEARLGRWLAAAVRGNEARCRIAEGFLAQVTLAPGLLPAAVEMGRLLATLDDAPMRAFRLNNLSNCLAENGDTAGALAAIHKAVEIRRRLAGSEPARYEPDLASSLNNLSNRLANTGDTAGALAVIGEAVEIYRRLAGSEPARYEPALATSLNNLSVHLAETGDTAGALAASGEAVEIYRRLAGSEPARYEPDLASSLNNLSNRLAETGDAAGALAVVGEAVEIRRRLAGSELARYEPDLASSLDNLGCHSRAVGDIARAREAFAEGIRLVTPHAERYPDGPAGRLLRTLRQELADTPDR